MANGRPKRSVASATLALVPSLPQAAMSGHVMSSFHHTLIGLGPFADLGCKIVFTKTSVTVYHPDGHIILSGWRDETGPRLWHFPLTAEAPHVALDNAVPQSPISSPPQHAPPADVVSTPKKEKCVSVSARKRKRSCNSAVKHRRHTSLRRRVVFILLAHHVDNDSMIWRRGCPPDECTTYRIDSLTAHLPAPIIAPLPGHPHPSQGILATSTSGS